MPRPRIRPENRQRAYKACSSCKALKKRCDSQMPCAMCVRRNCASTCSYQHHSAPRPPLHSPPADLNHQRSINGSRDADLTNGDGDDVEVNIAISPLSEACSSSAPQATKSRMLLSSRGERSESTACCRSGQILMPK